MARASSPSPGAHARARRACRYWQEERQQHWRAVNAHTEATSGPQPRQPVNGPKPRWLRLADSMPAKALLRHLEETGGFLPALRASELGAAATAEACTSQAREAGFLEERARSAARWRDSVARCCKAARCGAGLGCRPAQQLAAFQTRARSALASVLAPAFRSKPQRPCGAHLCACPAYASPACIPVRHYGNSRRFSQPALPSMAALPLLVLNFEMWP